MCGVVSRVTSLRDEERRGQRERERKFYSYCSTRHYRFQTRNRQAKGTPIDSDVASISLSQEFLACFCFSLSLCSSILLHNNVIPCIPANKQNKKNPFKIRALPWQSVSSASHSQTISPQRRKVAKKIPSALAS